MSLFTALGKMLYHAAGEKIARDEYDAATRRRRERNARQPRLVVAAAREVAEVADRMGDDFDRDTIALHILRDRIADLDREA